MREICISIKPEWVEKILNGEKTIEFRKTKPELNIEYRVFIYCTKGKTNEYLTKTHDNDFIYSNDGKNGYWGSNILNGKIVGVFTLKMIDRLTPPYSDDLKYVKNYLGEKGGYAWHIDDLKIFNNPLELSSLGLTRAPQSWQYLNGSKICYIDDFLGGLS